LKVLLNERGLEDRSIVEAQSALWFTYINRLLL
jgi:hypothetical protein